MGGGASALGGELGELSGDGGGGDGGGGGGDGGRVPRGKTPDLPSTLDGDWGGMDACWSMPEEEVKLVAISPCLSLSLPACMRRLSSPPPLLYSPPLTSALAMLTSPHLASPP